MVEKPEGLAGLREENARLERALEAAEARARRLEEVERGLQEALHELSNHQEELRTQNEDLRVSRRRLEETSHKYAALFHNAPVGYVILDADQKITDLNAVAAHLLGTEFRRFRGKPLFLYLDGGEGARWHRFFDATLENGRGQLETVLIHADGSPVPVILEVVALDEVPGEGWRCLVSIVDIRDRKQMETALRQSESRFRALFHQNPLGTQILSPDGTALGVNPAWERLWGRAAAEVAGRNMLDDGHFRAASGETLLRQAYSQGVAEIPAIPFGMDVGPDTDLGEARWIRSLAYPIHEPDEKVSEVILMHEDITERKRAERCLEAALRDLQRSNAELQQFAHVASHDLQEPLRTTIMYTQLLEKRYGDLLDAEGRQFLDFIVGAGRRMRQLVADLLSYSRVDVRSAVFEPVALAGVLDVVLQDLGQAVLEQEARVSIGPLPEVVGDRSQLIQVFRNLIGNALKYRHPERPPEVRVEGVDDGESWMFSVRDNGMGIEPQYAERIFQIFQRLHSDASIPGTGIGLAICRKIVERHGGAIWLERGVADGAEFRFTLAKAPVAPPADRPSLSATRSRRA